jgi:hypothetical protein
VSRRDSLGLGLGLAMDEPGPRWGRPSDLGMANEDGRSRWPPSIISTEKARIVTFVHQWESVAPLGVSWMRGRVAPIADEPPLLWVNSVMSRG